MFGLVVLYPLLQAGLIVAPEVPVGGSMPRVFEQIGTGDMKKYRWNKNSISLPRNIISYMLV